ncbi:MAG: phosphoglycerate kinase, partial [Stellaceae bacterium]
MTDFRTLDHVDVNGKRVLMRVDLNVPVENGIVADATRIERAAPGIVEIADKGGKVILLSHFGRPKGRDAKDSLKPVAAEVARVIKRPVKFVDDCIGEKAESAIAAMRPGDIVCLENTRFHAGEEKNDPAFVAALAKLGDIWVNDAFSAAHRAHASTEGLGHVLPAYAGRSLQAELEAFGTVLDHPARPLVAIVGGAKISTKLDMLGHLLRKVETLIVGGAMANTFLLAQGKPVGKSLVERDLVETATQIMNEAARTGREIVLPVDVVVAEKFVAHAPSRTVDVDKVGANDMILDIGSRSIDYTVSVLARAKTLVWNGPFGAFELEPFDTGTDEVAEAAAELTAAGKLVSVAGGGDTVA